MLAGAAVGLDHNKAEQKQKAQTGGGKHEQTDKQSKLTDKLFIN